MESVNLSDSNYQDFDFINILELTPSRLHFMSVQKNKPIADFEKSLTELEIIVKRMEQGDQSLEDTIKDFDRGMKLSELCREGLDEAQQKVEMLVKKHGNYKLEMIDNDSGTDNQSREED